MANKPIGEFKIWPVKAAVWRNDVRDGKFSYSVTLERCYKDDKGEYQSTNSLFRDDLLSAAKALDQAHSWILKQEAKDREGK